MIADRIEGKWIDLFAEVFARCKVGAGDACAILSESQSRALIWGDTDKPGALSHWPGGLVLYFPQANAVAGTLVEDGKLVNA